MKRLIPVNLILVLSGLSIFIHSCTPESCFEETESFLKVSFYDDVTKKLRAPDSLTIYGLNNDSILYNNIRNVQPALIPLNTTEIKCVFIITINDMTDTVEFSYSSYPHLISKECGYTFYHNLDQEPIFTSNAINNIYISKSIITTNNEENIRIFY